MCDDVVRRRCVAVAVSLLVVGAFGTSAAAQSKKKAETGEKQAKKATGEAKTSSTSSVTSTYGYALRDGALSVRSDGEEVRTIDIPCEPVAVDEGTALAREDDRVLVACGVEGIYTFDVTDRDRPKALGFREPEGSVAGFFRTDGRLWVRLQTEQARPAASITKTPESRKRRVPPRRTAPPAERSDGEPSSEAEEESEESDEARADDRTERDEGPTGEVVESRPGTVVIGLGVRDGLVSGDHIELYRSKTVELGTGKKAEQTETLAVGKVTTVSEDRAQVVLGLNEHVPTGVRARPVSAGTSTTANAIAPPREGGMRSISVMLRPILPLGTLGLGMGGDASFKWAFKSPLMLEIQADPLGFGIGNQPSVGALAGDISLSYDSPYFRVGLGVGGSGIGTPRRAFGNDQPLIKSGVTVVQVVRFGARDGLHLRAYNSLIAFNGAFQWGDILISGQVPMHEVLNNTWLVGRGTHQRAGQAYGEIGLRVLTGGNGGPGTTFLEATIGGGGVWGSQTVECSQNEPGQFGQGSGGPCTEEVLYGGPMVGLGFEQRF